MKKIVYCFRFLILFVVAVSFISITTPNFCLASREDVVLSEEYQLESEKETLKDKFIWEINLEYGYVFTKREVNPWPSRPPKEYLDTLDMVYSKNDLSLGFGAKYLLTSKLAIYAGMPVSLLRAEINSPRKRRGVNTAHRIGIGDIYGGISYALLTESKYRPLVITTFEVNSALSKYTALGDGFWGLTPALSLRKFVSGPIYVKGLAGYTHRLDRKGINPGGIVNYGGGVGFLSEDMNIELNLERIYRAKTKIGDRTLIGSNEDLVIDVAFSSTMGKQTYTIELFYGGLEDGFNWDQNYAGISYGFSF